MKKLLKRLFGSPKHDPAPTLPVVVPTIRQRDNAIVYTAKRAAMHAVVRGDHTGAVLDMVRTLRRYGWDAGWLDPMAADAIMNRDSRGFVQGFACDDAAAVAWLANNSLEASHELLP